MKSMLKALSFSVMGLMSSSMVNAQSNYWIVGGQNAVEGQFPWLGDIRIPFGTERYHLCGSALVDPYWVLTAAHCLTGPEFGEDAPTHVRFNTVSTNTQTVNPNGGVDAEIDTIYRHRSFDMSMSLGNGYDIGLIKLKQPVTTITPITLPQQADTAHYYQANRTVRTAGWGLVDTFSTTSADIMKWTNTKIIGRVKCNQYFQSPPGQDVITERVVCVGYEGSEDQSGAAAGDSGGPLWIESNGTKYIIGVVSGGANNTTLHEQPGIYTNVAYLRPWIDSVMGANPTSIPKTAGFNDQNMSIGMAQHDVRLKIGDINSQTIFVQLSNIEGKILHQQTIHNPKFRTFQIPVSAYAAGMYVIRIYDNAGNHMYRKLHHISH